MATLVYTQTSAAVIKNTFWELVSEDVVLQTRPRAISDLTWRLKSEGIADEGSKSCCADLDGSVTTGNGSTTCSLSTSWSVCDSDDEDSSCWRSVPNSRSTQRSGTGPSNSDDAVRPTSRVFPVKQKTGNSGRTSLMLRNIPVQFSRSDLLELLAAHDCLMDVRFLYLPLESATGSAFGYAFVAFANGYMAENCRSLLDGMEMSTGKALQVDWSSSSFTANEEVERFRNSALMHPSVADALRPIVLVNGIRTTFPAPTKKLRVPRQRYQQRMMRASKLASPAT